MVLLHTATDAANPGVFLGFGSIELLTGDLPYDNINSMQEATGKRRTGDWLKKLRGQFERIASRRVGPDDVEDVVQDAMRVVAEKGLKGAAGPAAELPHLAWCFQVLRHTIGNHYRRVRTRRQWVVSDTEQVGDENVLSHHAIESQGSIEVLLIIEAALAEMANDHPQCGRYLSRLVEGARPREVADEEQLASAVFARRLYRCRQKLRNLLAMKGVEI